MAIIKSNPITDERYGYPVRATAPDGQSISGYLVGEQESDQAYIVSMADESLDLGNVEKWGQVGNEALALIPKADIVFLDPPPVGRVPDQIRYDNGVMFLNSEVLPLRDTLMLLLAGKFAPYELRIAYSPLGKQKIDILAIYDRPTEIGKVMLINALKGLGIWGLTYLTLTSTPPSRFTSV